MRVRRNSINTSFVARRLRHLIYDLIMTGRATNKDRAEADQLAVSIGIMKPSEAKNLSDLEKIGSKLFARLDKSDKVAEYSETEHSMQSIPYRKPPPEPGEEWKNPSSKKNPMKTRRNSPLTPTQAAALQQILASHGWSKSNPPNYARKRKSTWKKRFGSRKAMVRYMAKIRRLRSKKRR